jgi:spermidine synthase
MNPLRRVKSVQEFHELDAEQGVERIYLYYKTGSSHLHTEKQEVDILESPFWGSMLFLDGTLQSTTRDEVIYHTLIVHPLMHSLCNKNKVLILGGGEGATAREVLRWPVESVTMVDYDRELVEHMKAYGSKWSNGAFDDPRLTVLYDDAWNYLKTPREYDGIIIDLTDPELKIQKWKVLLRLVMASIKKSSGSFIMNAGLYNPWNTESLKEINLMVHDICMKHLEYRYHMYTSYIPSFNGEWTFIIVYPRSQPIVIPESISVIPAWIRRTVRALSTELLDVTIDTTPCISKIKLSPPKERSS